MSHENYNYEKIQKSLLDKGWTGTLMYLKHSRRKGSGIENGLNSVA